MTLTRLQASGRVRWGFIGAGDVTEVKSGPAFRKVAGSSVSVVMRRDADKARDYAQRHGVPRWTTDACAVVGAHDVDAVYVATPPSSHAEYVAMAAAAGKPVYVEKPLARDVAEGEAIVRACEAAGVPLFVAFYRRALPRFEFVRGLIQGGTLGALTFVRLELSTTAPSGPESAGWRWDPEIGGDGLLLDLGSHALDLLDHWLGPLAEVYGASTTRLPWSRVTDQVVGAFKWSSGALGTAAWDFAAARGHDRLDLTFTEGHVSVPVFLDGPVKVTGPAGTEERRIPHPPHIQEPLITLIVEGLLGRGAACPSTGASALRTQRAMEALLERSGTRM